MMRGARRGQRGRMLWTQLCIDVQRVGSTSREGFDGSDVFTYRDAGAASGGSIAADGDGRAEARGGCDGEGHRSC
jgi:hypothetical protein